MFHWTRHPLYSLCGFPENGLFIQYTVFAIIFLFKVVLDLIFSHCKTWLGITAPRPFFWCGSWGSCCGDQTQWTAEEACVSLFTWPLGSSDPGAMSGSHCSWGGHFLALNLTAGGTGRLVSDDLLPFSKCSPGYHPHVCLLEVQTQSVIVSFYCGALVCGVF